MDLHTGIHLWLVHDGAQPYFLLTFHVYRKMQDKVDQQHGPACSPDLNPLDFISKEIYAYATEVNDVQNCKSTYKMDLR